MRPFEFGAKVAESLMGQPAGDSNDPGARSRALVEKMRAQGVRSGHFASGPGGFTTTRINQAAPTAAKPPVVAPKPLAPPTNKRVSRTAF